MVRRGYNINPDLTTLGKIIGAACLSVLLADNVKSWNILPRWACLSGGYIVR